MRYAKRVTENEVLPKGKSYELGVENNFVL
jgi:hypothetical protein